MPPPELKSGVWYTIGDRRYLSVTAALDHLDAPGLMIWSANLAAAYAAENLPVLTAALRTKPCGETKRDRRCGQCLPCLQTKAARQHWYRSEEAKRRGSAVHDVIEFWAQRGDWPSYDPAYEPYIAALRALLDEYALTPDSWTMTEATVYHEADGWAGTLDGIVVVEPRTRASAEFCARMGHVDQATTILIDTKTREGTGARFYAQQPLQLAGYRHAQWVLVGGRNVEMPPVHGGAVLQLRPDGSTLRPVRCGEDEYATFCAVLKVAQWMLSETGGDRAHQVQAFPVPDEWMWRLPEDAVPTGMENGSKTRRGAAGRPSGQPAAARAATRGPAKKAAGRRLRSVPSEAVDAPAPAGPGIVEQVRRGMPPLPKAHPDSPYQDEIPF